MKRKDYHCGYWYYYLALEPSELLSFCKEDNYIGSGKGGQKRNKTANAVRLRFDKFLVEATRSRSRQENLKNALKKLRLQIALDIGDNLKLRLAFSQDVPKWTDYSPSGSIPVNPNNQHFPIFCGIILDSFCRHGTWGGVATEFSLSIGQLKRLTTQRPELQNIIKNILQSLNPQPEEHNDH